MTDPSTTPGATQAGPVPGNLRKWAADALPASLETLTVAAEAAALVVEANRAAAAQSGLEPSEPSDHGQSWRVHALMVTRIIDDLVSEVRQTVTLARDTLGLE